MRRQPIYLMVVPKFATELACCNSRSKPVFYLFLPAFLYVINKYIVYVRIIFTVTLDSHIK